ncbi:PfkB family carbohydrate kinase [Dethiothermospora halolimnae]|uniref:PfkB family carbohydrate kinase n=1 Tax=Dethiothermospora halolimnae TaxID=3114390 RepID=UPI003CCBCBD4
MTSREKEILNILRSNPLISQQQLAKELGITRSSVAVHIGNLIKKGHIKGKGYILNEERYITVIGGTNIDIQGFTGNKLILNDSNPGSVKTSLGGVGRNIAENTTKLGIKTKLISVLGNDLYGKRILKECRMAGIDMDNCLVINGNTSTYLSILDENRDMKVAISDMDNFSQMNVDYIKQKNSIINKSKIVVIDTNIDYEVIEYILSNFNDKVFFLDAVSTTKCKKVKDLIGKFHTIKPNKIEAEALSGIKINKEEDLNKALDYFLQKGVKKVFISLGEDGVFYGDENTKGIIRSPKINVVNATGAGDAFMAGLIYSYINNYNIHYSSVFSMTSSILALSHEDTINPNISVENINKKIKELRIC